MPNADAPLLEVDDLRIEFRSGREIVRAVNGASFTVRRGETTAVLGESGSGKSVTAAAIMRLLASPPAHITGGRIRFNGADVLGAPMAQWRKRCGRDIGMVFQDALASLNPVFTVGWQIAEPFKAHGVLPAKAALERAVALLGRVGIPEPHARAHDYPHQFSGGMRQRVMIAMAIALDPSLLIADEPTTALDVTVQAQIMDLLLDLQRERHMAMVLITHDLGVVAEVADRVAVMYGGRVVESGLARDVLPRPAHPYTLALLESVPRSDIEQQQLNPIVGSPPNMATLPSGCAFHPRCRRATSECRAARPPTVKVAPGHHAECFYAQQVFDGR
ncbi:MAG: ABC transporter ATP-binding protein [Betaproteobacteria bacterium]|nr:ABC transporter ATP-binding protein [Betaproteobacteria bacterium]